MKSHLEIISKHKDSKMRVQFMKLAGLMKTGFEQNLSQHLYHVAVSLAEAAASTAAKEKGHRRDYHADLQSAYEWSECSTIFGHCKERGKFYRMAAEFSHSLIGAEFKIPGKYIDLTDTVYYIQFPSDLRFDLNGLGMKYAISAYVFVGLADAVADGEATNQFDGEKRVVAFVPDADKNGKYTGGISRFVVPLGPDNSGKDILKWIRTSEHFTNIALVEYIVKALLYIQSGDPDLRHLKSPRHTLNDRKWERLQETDKTVSAFDWELVGYNFKKPRVYSQDEVIVKAHLRRQRCGPKFKDTKIIWIDEHVRHYSEVEDLEDEFE